MKNKIVEILVGLLKYYGGTIADDDKLYETAVFIDALYPTLNRDKVMEILNDKYEAFPARNVRVADSICSLALPTLSEGEIEKMVDAYQPISPVAPATGSELRIRNYYRTGILDALKALTKP